ncbi:hypothetical protein [Helicobacter sp. UBA3407]|nr:hypothetical protein [Helicobacter sp. UBA3407]
MGKLLRNVRHDSLRNLAMTRGKLKAIQSYGLLRLRLAMTH